MRNGILTFNVVSLAGSDHQSRLTFKVLEPYAGKLARSVLKGLGRGDPSRLPDYWTGFFTLVFESNIEYHGKLRIL